MPSKRKNEDASAESDDDSIDSATTTLTPAAQRDDGTWPRMPAAIWGERTEDGNYRNDNGDIDEDGLWRYHSGKRYWVRDQEYRRHIQELGPRSLSVKQLNHPVPRTPQAEFGATYQVHLFTRS